MEFVAGQTLTAWAAARPRTWAEVLPLLADVARGISAAHAVGLVHRDLKPDNVMLGSDGRVRVMDFGLAHGRRAAASEPAPTLGTDSTDRISTASRLTAVGALQGTPAYMAPEQWKGQEAEPAADQFGWSVMAWELLYGERPFPEQTMVTLCAAVLSGQRKPPPRGRRVPGWLRRVIERGLAAEPTMAALLAALERGRKRARIRAAAAVVAGVALLGAGAEGYRRWDIARRMSICAAAGAEIDRSWNDDTRQQLRDAFMATGMSYAETSANKVLPWLDERARAWKQARTEVCSNADLRGVWDADLVDRALWCLEDRRIDLAALAAELGRANATSVRMAVNAAARLSGAEACLDEGLLLHQPAPPAHEREAIREVRVLLSQAESLALAGDPKAALTVTIQARELARGMRDRSPLLAVARAHEGNLLEKTAAYEAAEAASAEAYFEAVHAGAWRVAAVAATDLVSTVGDKQARHGEGRAWAQHAEVALAHAGDRDGLLEARRLNRLATLHLAAGAYPEARALYERALALYEQTLGPDHPDVAVTLSNLSNGYLLAGAYPEARALSERTLAIYEQALGPDHPELAVPLNNLASVHLAAGAYPEARALYERSLAIWERALDEDHPDIAVSLNNLAVVLEKTGAYAEARTMIERALVIFEKSLGPDHPHVGATLDSLAVVLVKTGAYAEARALSERALAIQERALGPEHPDVAMSLNSLAGIHLVIERPRDALPLLERALAIYTAHEGVQSGEMDAQLGLARALVATHGDRARALALAATARAGYREAGDIEMLAEVEQFLAAQEVGE
jgi:tetratricopeptide (TPR) repeat protein